MRKGYTDQETSVHIVGFPMLMGWIYSLKPQMYTVFAISVILMVLVLFIMFRNFHGMIAPMANALILMIWGLGFTGYMGINLSPLLFVLPFLVGARALSHTVQITHRYFEEYHRSGSKEQAAVETVSTMFLPNVSAILAEVMGFSVIYLAKIVLMQQLAAIMTLWMFSIFPGAAILAPVICYYLPPPKAKELFHHFAAWETHEGRAAPSFEGFAKQAVAPIDSPAALPWFYNVRVTDYAAALTAPGLAFELWTTEWLARHLEAAECAPEPGHLLTVEGYSYRNQTHAYYSPDLLATVRPWTQPQARLLAEAGQLRPRHRRATGPLAAGAYWSLPADERPHYPEPTP